MLFGSLSTIDNNGQPKRTRQMINKKTLNAGFLKRFLLYLIGNPIAVLRPFKEFDKSAPYYIAYIKNALLAKHYGLKVQ
jgi:hypothetical protein